MDSLSYTLLPKECYNLNELFVKTADTCLKKNFQFLLSAFFTLRAPTQPNPLIPPQNLRCRPLAVDYYSFVGHFLNLNVRVGWVGLSSRIIHLEYELFIKTGIFYPDPDYVV
jgi:hypothetical protein